MFRYGRNDTEVSWFQSWYDAKQQPSGNTSPLASIFGSVNVDEQKKKKALSRTHSLFGKESLAEGMANHTLPLWFSVNKDQEKKKKQPNTNTTHQLPKKQISRKSSFLFGMNNEEEPSSSSNNKPIDTGNKQSSTKSLPSLFKGRDDAVDNDEEDSTKKPWYCSNRIPRPTNEQEKESESDDQTRDQSRNNNPRGEMKYCIVLFVFGFLVILAIGIALGVLIVDDDDDDYSKYTLATSSSLFLPAGCFKENEMVVNFNATDPIKCSQRCSAFLFYSISEKGCGCMNSCPVVDGVKEINNLICNCNSLPTIENSKEATVPSPDDHESKEALYALISLVLAPILLCLQEPCRLLFLHWYKRRRPSDLKRDPPSSSSSLTSSDGQISTTSQDEDSITVSQV